MRDPVVSVVIGTYNRLRFLRCTIATVRAELIDTPHEIVVVDGGSTDGTTSWLARQDDILLIVHHNRTLGRRGIEAPRQSWGRFMNLGFRAASADTLCMLSDDTLVIDGAIRHGLQRLGEVRAEGGRVGGVAFYWRNWPEEVSYSVGVAWGGTLFVNHGLYTREALEAVDYIDEVGFRFYHADGDLCLRFEQAGFTCIASPDSYIEHFAHANRAVRTTNAIVQRDDWSEYVRRWEHLGVPEIGWLRKEHTDPTRTAQRYWGRARLRLQAEASLVHGLRRGRSWMRAAARRAGLRR